jgi:hypothetical protein
MALCRLQKRIFAFFAAGDSFCEITFSCSGKSKFILPSTISSKRYVCPPESSRFGNEWAPAAGQLPNAPRKQVHHDIGVNNNCQGFFTKFGIQLRLNLLIAMEKINYHVFLTHVDAIIGKSLGTSPKNGGTCLRERSATFTWGRSQDLIS